MVFPLSIALHVLSQSPAEAVSCSPWTVGLRKKLSCPVAELAVMQKTHKSKYSLSLQSGMFLLQCTISVQFRTSVENQTGSVFRRSVSDCFFVTCNFSSAGHPHNVTVSIAAN